MALTPRRFLGLALLAGALAASAVYLAEPDRRIMLMAHAGSSTAQFELAKNLLGSDGSDKNREEAGGWIRRAARSGHRDAQLVNYLLKYVNAVNEVDKAGDQSASAVKVLDQLEKTEEWTLLQSAAEAGHPPAEEALAEHYQNKVNAKFDISCRERESKEPAARQSPAEEMFGAHIEECEAKDDWDAGRVALRNEAVKWFRRAAQHGSVSAQRKLSFLLGDLGWFPNEVESFRWNLRLANAGHEDSQYRVGIALEKGEGEVQDLVEAYKWLSLSAGGGEPSALSERDELKKLLTREQLDEAQRRAAEWRSRHDWYRSDDPYPK